MRMTNANREEKRREEKRRTDTTENTSFIPL